LNELTNPNEATDVIYDFEFSSEKHLNKEQDKMHRIILFIAIPVVSNSSGVKLGRAAVVYFQK